MYLSVLKCISALKLCILKDRNAGQHIVETSNFTDWSQLVRKGLTVNPSFFLQLYTIIPCNRYNIVCSKKTSHKTVFTHKHGPVSVVEASMFQYKDFVLLV